MFNLFIRNNLQTVRAMLEKEESALCLIVAGRIKGDRELQTFE